MSTSWPELSPVDAPSSLENIMILKGHCRAIIQHFLGNLQAPAPPSTYTVQLAVITNEALDKIIEDDQQHIRRTIDGMAAAQVATQARLEQTAKEIAIVATAAPPSDTPIHSRLIEKWTEETRPAGTTTPHTSISASQTPSAAEPTEYDLRTRLRWQKGQSPYRNAPPDMIRSTVNGLLRSSKNSILRNIDVAAVRKLRSGDLDVYTHTVAEKERLVENSNDWLPRLERGQQVRILDSQYAILVHGVPAEFLPKSRVVAEAIDEVVRSNPTTLTQNEVVYLGWVKGHEGVGQKTRSSMVIAFSDACTANKMIREGLFLRSERMRTELYDPGCRVVQCAKCVQFGHVMAMCSSTVCCPFCALAHSRKQCPDRKNPSRYKCALCQQSHAATDRQKCPKWREQLSILETVQKKKARLFPVPAESAPAVVRSSEGENTNTKSGNTNKQIAKQPSGWLGKQPQCTGNHTVTTREKILPGESNHRQTLLRSKTLRAGETPLPNLHKPVGRATNQRHDPLDDNMPSFDSNTSSLETVREHFHQRIIAQKPKHPQTYNTPTTGRDLPNNRPKTNSIQARLASSPDPIDPISERDTRTRTIPGSASLQSRPTKRRRIGDQLQQL
jgi:hypothetical protein